jgi:hypothetical protein
LCVKSIAKQIFEALDYLHTRSKSVIHRDVAPDNIMLRQYDENNEDSIRVILSDFDTVREIEEGLTVTKFVGHENYSAPEIDKRYGPPVDIWSAGAVLFELMTLTRVKKETLLDSTIVKQQLEDQMEPKGPYSKGLVEMVLFMLKLDPKSRPTAGILLSYFEKKWTTMLMLAGKHGSLDMLHVAVEYYKLTIDKYRHDTALTEGLYGACEGGHLELVQYIERTSDWFNHYAKEHDYSPVHYPYWNWCLPYACKGGSIPVVKYILEKKGAKSSKCLYEITKNDHGEVYDLLAEEGYTVKDWNQGLIGACTGGHMSWVLKMIEKGANSWDEAFQAACTAGNVDIIMMLHNRVTNNNDALAVVCDQGKSSLIDLIISYGADDWNKGLYGAAKGGHMILVTWMINKGATNWNAGLWCS